MTTPMDRTHGVKIDLESVPPLCPNDALASGRSRSSPDHRTYFSHSDAIYRRRGKGVPRGRVLIADVAGRYFGREREGADAW